MPSSSRRELHGPRPPPLKLNKDSWKVQKAATAASSQSELRHRPEPPVVVFLHTPKVIHTRPQDFMSLVQRLTGKSSSSSSSSSSSRCSTGCGLGRVEVGGKRAPGMDERTRVDVDGGGEGGDPLLLRLGQFSSMSSVPSPVASPSLFFCSPSTQRSLQDFSPLF